MPVGYRNSAGVDFDDLFDPDVQGDGPTAPFLRTAAGVAVRYADISYGSKGPNVGYRTSAGVDVSNLWAAKGTARYETITDAGIRSPLAVSTPDSQQVISVGFEYRRNGTAMWFDTSQGSGNWAHGAGANPGDNYDIRFSTSGAPGWGVLAGATGAWQRLNATRAVNFSGTSPGFPSQSDVGVLIEIRSRASGQVLVSRSVSLILQYTS